MRTRRPTAGERPLAQREDRPINLDHLEIVARAIAGLKAEQAAGTPIDHRQIAQLEEHLNKLRLQQQGR